MHPPTLDVKLSNEYKYFDTSGGGVLAVAGVIIDVSAPVQGIGAVQRIGDEISLVALQLGIVATVTAAAPVSNTMRVLLVRWQNDSSVVVPTTTAVLQTTGLASAVVPYNMQNSRNGLFSVVFDQSFAFAPIASANPTVIVKRELNLRGTNLRFGPAALTGEGKIFLFIVGAQASTNYDYYTRLIYLDSA